MGVDVRIIVMLALNKCDTGGVDWFRLVQDIIQPTHRSVAFSREHLNEHTDFINGRDFLY
jgi:hypothetical protein